MVVLMKAGSKSHRCAEWDTSRVDPDRVLSCPHHTVEMDKVTWMRVRPVYGRSFTDEPGPPVAVWVQWLPAGVEERQHQVSPAIAEAKRRLGR